MEKQNSSTSGARPGGSTHQTGQVEGPDAGGGFLERIDWRRMGMSIRIKFTTQNDDELEVGINGNEAYIALSDSKNIPYNTFVCSVQEAKLIASTISDLMYEAIEQAKEDAKDES